MGPRSGPSTRGPSHRLAVLPLTNISVTAGDDYFVDGMTEELISTLSRVPGLTVIARTSAMQYKGTTKSIPRVAQELGVQTLLEGSVRKSGSSLRIQVRLVDASGQGDLWSETYDRELQDVFRIQREIAQRTRRALRLRLGRRGPVETEATPSPGPNACDLYLRGRLQWNLRTEAGLRRAVELFERAVEKGRTFAPALCGIADAWAQLGWLEFSRKGSQSILPKRSSPVPGDGRNQQTRVIRGCVQRTGHRVPSPGMYAPGGF